MGSLNQFQIIIPIGNIGCWIINNSLHVNTHVLSMI